ncbi:MAG: ABC transporter permease [Oscillospiraceae bacterium]|nr:ABC transporter permease [Oscillospiraceae bacterium]MBR2896755.1 ABC transporter permease [Oscillospiraceae bacterium]MBR3849143.1 ABC transporter permease [Oscillospiraceae bacterium]
MQDLIISTLTQGLIYALLACGIYITYKILDFPDLTVDGSFPLGAAVTAVLLTHGVDPWLSLVAAMAVGAVAGLCTGVIHVRFKVRDLLSGIITMTALFSINLQIAGSNLVVDRGTDTIFTSAPVMALFGGTSLLIRKLIVALLLVLIAKLLLDLYFKTRSGMLLRAAGDNATLVTTLAKNTGSMKILGLVIANALVALAGSVVCQEQRAFSATMGTGQMVFGLAAVIIGSTAFRRLDFVKGTTAAILGSVIYKICIQVAISLGLPAKLMKLATALLFLVILVLGSQRKERVRKGKEAPHHA